MLTQTLITTRQVSTSSNFWTNLTSIILSFLAYIGISELPDAGQVVDAITAQDWAVLVMIAVNLINKIIHIWDPTKIKDWFWEFLKSTNFWTNVITLLLGLLVTMGAVFPENAVSELVDAIMGGDLGLLIAAIAINIINPIYHIFFKKD